MFLLGPSEGVDLNPWAGHGAAHALKISFNRLYTILLLPTFLVKRIFQVFQLLIKKNIYTKIIVTK